MQLGDMTKLIRAKNAGPFMLTIDIIFTDEKFYEQALHSKKITVEAISQLYNLPVNVIKIIECKEINTIKVSFPRAVPSGDIGDGDVFGGQQHGPLVSLEIT
jgi:Domain of unknown function (DUF4387)